MKRTIKKSRKSQYDKLWQLLKVKIFWLHDIIHNGQKPIVKPCLHQISFNCIEKLVECIGKFNKDEIDCDTLYKIQKQILIEEIKDEEFLESATENFSEMMRYIAQGKVSIRIHRDVTGEMWYGVK